MKNILILYYSQSGSTKKMAHTIALGAVAPLASTPRAIVEVQRKWLTL